LQCGINKYFLRFSLNCKRSPSFTELHTNLEHQLEHVLPQIPTPAVIGKTRGSTGSEAAEHDRSDALDSELPRTTPARGPPLWDACDAQMGDGVEGADVEPNWG
jgi:hypothetical protein